jgi:hypothetical protein
MQSWRGLASCSRHARSSGICGGCIRSSASARARSSAPFSARAERGGRTALVSDAKRLLGRRAECETLDHVLADVAAGRSRAVVLRGEAGVGKSDLTRRTAEWRVVTAVGVESEMELAYNGVHPLCAPLLDDLERLPEPQRDALATAFGLSVGRAPVPRRARDTDAAGRGRRAATAALPHRRRAMAGPGLGADHRLRRTPVARGARRARCRSA